MHKDARPPKPAWGAAASGTIFKGLLFGSPQVDRSRPATLGCDFVVDLLALVEAVQARPLDRADMHEHILAAVRRLDEPIPLRGVEPLHRTCRHHSRSLAV